MKLKLLLSLAIVSIVVSCENKTSGKINKEIDRLSKRIDILENRTGLINNDIVTSLSNKVNSLAFRADFLLESDLKQGVDIELLKNESTEIDLSSKNFQMIRSNGFTFFIVVEDVKPYLNGYQLTFLVGNATSADFSECEIKATWNGKFIPGPPEDYYKWEANSKKESFRIPDTIVAGKWNPIDIILKDVKPEDFESFSLQIELGKLSLRKPQQIE